MDNGRLFGKCPTSFQLVAVFPSRLLPEASTSLKLVGHGAARFSLFQGVAHCDMDDSSENKFVVPPLGRKRRMQTHSVTVDACGLKAGLRTALLIVSGRRSLRHGRLLGKLSSDAGPNRAVLSVTRIKLKTP